MNFLVAYDTDKNAPVSTGVPLQWLTKIIQENVHCDRNSLFLDVCHSGSAIAGQTLLASRSSGNQTVSDSPDASQPLLADNAIMQNASKELTIAKPSAQAGQKSLIRTPSAQGQQQLALGSGQVILCSSLADQISWESKNYPNGVFTRRLIEALQCKGDDTSLSEAYKQLRQSVESEVLHDRGNLQTPQLSNKDWSGGDPFVGVIPSAPRSASTK
jgi:hypothetical protein